MREQMAQHRANPTCADLSQDDGSDRLRARELRRGRRVADAASRAAPIDASGELAGRHQRSTAWSRCAHALAAAARGVRPHDDREAADLRARPRARRIATCRSVRAIVREAAAHDYRFSSHRARHRQAACRFRCEWQSRRRPSPSNRSSRETHDVPWTRRSRLPRRTFLRGVARRWRCRCSTRWCRRSRRWRRRRRTPRTRFGAVFIPNGAIMEPWTPAGAGPGFEFSPILKPLEPFRDSTGGDLEPRRAPATPGGDHAVSAAGWLTGVGAEAHRGGRHPGRHHDRSGRGAADRAGHAVSVARAGHRGFHRLHRRVHDRLQLRLHEHDLVELADDAAADGDQPARRVRAAVRRARAPAPSAAARRQRDRSILDFITRGGRTTCGAGSGRATAPGSTSISTTSARSSGESSAPRRTTAAA